MKRARYICIEGTEGVGKTTQTEILTAKLRSLGYKVLQTKEPGTSHLPITMKMRELMLSNEFDQELSAPSREFISQAIRSIHLEKLIIPSMTEYDFIVQDRGMLSGYSYGVACGNHLEDLRRFAKINTKSATIDNKCGIYPEVQYIPESIYDRVILLTGNVEMNLNKAISSKKEFKSGDAMESRGTSFIENVAELMDAYSSMFNSKKISVENKNIEQVHVEIMQDILDKYNEKK